MGKKLSNGAVVEEGIRPGMLGPLGWVGGPHTLLSRGRHHIERGAGGAAVTHKRKDGILTVYTDVSPTLVGFYRV